MQSEANIKELDRKRIIKAYCIGDLQAPFKINLIESVEKIGNTENGDDKHYIPDMQDLLHSIVLYRTIEIESIKGSDVQFLRKSLGLRAREVSNPLSISREHFSRCENESVAMSNSLETLIRIFILNKVVCRLGIGLKHRNITLQSGLDMIFDRKYSNKTSDRRGDYELNLRRKCVDKLTNPESEPAENFAWLKADII